MAKADVTTESLAAELAELIYKRWVDGAERGYERDFAGIEAVMVLAEALRICADDPQAGAAMMQGALRALSAMAPFAGQGDFQREFANQTSGLSSRYGRRIVAP